MVTTTMVNGFMIPLRGKTFHQCRQKTLGYHTQCSQCNPSVRDQICGDFLYMRYGEHVLEALENLDWICPVCHEICNCNLCRKQKWLLPTGSAYRKALKLAGVHEIAVEVWWGTVERFCPLEFKWSPYEELFRLIS